MKTTPKSPEKTRLDERMLGFAGIIPLRPLIFESGPSAEVKSKYGVTHPPVSMTTRAEIKFKTFAIPAGVKAEVYFTEKAPSIIFVSYQDKTGNMPLRLANKYLSGIAKPPSMGTLEKWSMDGVARSVLGAKVEPDGIDPKGAPSWLMVMGFI